ncbi:MAG: M28 family peptidase [Thermoplasmatales archaeon]|nr:M28 family peptidase [Thermoplasmatales archaeon]
MKLKVFLIFAVILSPLLIPPAFPGNGCDGLGGYEEINEEMVAYYLTKICEFGPRYTGRDACADAEEWVYNEFLSMGLKVEKFKWKMGGFEDSNIVATLTGDEYSVIIGAHIDTTETSPGANDDASGVASVLAIAKVMSKYKPIHTTHFVVYTGEEVGAYGSYLHARHLYENGEKIIAIINVDMVGYANTSKGGNYIRCFTPERAIWIAQLANEVAEKYYGKIKIGVEMVPNYPGADHQAYVDYGYDGLFFAHYDSYPYGHSPNDSIDKINFTYLAKATKFLYCLLEEIANKKISNYVFIREPREGYFYFFGRALFPIVAKNWFSRARGITIAIGRVDVVAEVDGNVEKVIFAVDGRMWYWDYSPPYEWKLNVLLFGKHEIEVYAYGEEIARDEMDIIIFSPYIRR